MGKKVCSGISQAALGWRKHCFGRMCALILGTDTTALHFLNEMLRRDIWHEPQLLSLYLHLRQRIAMERCNKRVNCNNSDAIFTPKFRLNINLQLNLNNELKISAWLT